MKPLSSDTEFQKYARAIALRIVVTAAWLVTAIYLSDTSTYHIRGITSSTFGIAMMLTPWGMFHNWIDKSSYLRPFYSLPADRFGLFDDPSIRWAVLSFILLSLTLLVLLFRPKSK